jgi:MscS family membrane protein
MIFVQKTSSDSARFWVPGRLGTMTHDYKRNGTTTLFAAIELAKGKIIAECMSQHRHQEWLKFLKKIDRETPSDLDLHLIVDNDATHKHPKVKAWLKRHKRFHIHFTPTSSSWLNAQLIRIVSKLMSLAAAVVFVVGGQYVGIPIATLLASAGIGGIAIALGAQYTLKNLFGTMMLVADKPFRVGERIIFSNYDGIVEDIGLRSTRVRLLTSHLVTIPNDQLSGSHVENIARRSYIRRTGEIHIPLDTPCEKVEQAVAIIREKLDNHEGMDAKYPPRVFFDDISASSFRIQYLYWYTPPEYWQFKAFTEKLNFAIFCEFEKNGIQFSLPLRHSYWKSDDEQGPVDVNVVGASEATQSSISK